MLNDEIKINQIKKRKKKTTYVNLRYSTKLMTQIIRLR
jgi:hypothetical protein